MSQSIVVKAIYRNNKANVIGLHNPANNRIANDSEFNHLYDMWTKHIYPISEKFKRIDIFVFLQDGRKVPVLQLDTAINLIKSDTIRNN